MPYLPSLPSLLFSYRHLSFVMYQTQNFNVLPPHMLWKRPAATLMLWLLSSAQLNKHSSHLQVGRRCDVCLSRRVQPPLLLSSPTPLPVPPSPSFSLSEAKVRLVQVHGSLQLPSEKDQNFLRRFNLKDYCILFQLFWYIFVNLGWRVNIHTWANQLGAQDLWLNTVILCRAVVGPAHFLYIFFKLNL